MKNLNSLSRPKASEKFSSQNMKIHRLTSLHGESCGRRIERGLFKCKKLNKVFNADLVAAYNILITPSPADRGNGPETWPGIESLREM